MEISLVGHCAECGNPIYGPVEIEAEMTQVQVTRTCNCLKFIEIRLKALAGKTVLEEKLAGVLMTQKQISDSMKKE